MVLMKHIILVISASSCTLPKIPTDSFARINDNRITIQCNHSETKWDISCGEADKWQSLKHQCPTGKLMS